jgi:hypothetical protein
MKDRELIALAIVVLALVALSNEGGLEEYFGDPSVDQDVSGLGHVKREATEWDNVWTK